jgi:hypothetical protein
MKKCSKNPLFFRIYAVYSINVRLTLRSVRFLYCGVFMTRHAKRLFPALLGCLALAWGCDFAAVSPAEYYLEHTAPARITGVSALTMADDMVLPEGEAVITVDVYNPQKLKLRADLKIPNKPEDTEASLGPFGANYTSFTITITGTDSGDELDLALALESADGLREFPARSWHCIFTDKVSAASGGLVQVDGEYYGFKEALEQLDGGSSGSPLEVNLVSDITITTPLATGGHGSPSYIRLVPQGGDRRILAGANGMDRLIEVKNNGTLILEGAGGYELIIDGESREMGNALIQVEAGGAVEMNDGVRIINTNRQRDQWGDGVGGHGAGVRVYGIFNMHGGVISGHNISGRDGTVFVRGSSAVFTMDGGVISDNIAGSGGAVRIEGDAHFNMSGGAITRNTTSLADGGGGGGGGGVYNGGGTFHMTGGIISNNRAGGNGGGVCNDSGAFTKTGGIIYGNDGGPNSNRADSSNGGHAASSGFWGKNRRTTAGPGVDLDSDTADNWND